MDRKSISICRLVTAERIQELLLLDLSHKDSHLSFPVWLQQVEELLHDWNEMPPSIRIQVDCSKWIITQRPPFVSLKDLRIFDPTVYKHYSVVKKLFDAWDNSTPFWAWLGIHIWWFSFYTGETINKFFFLILQCGCNTREVLNSPTKSGILPIEFSVISNAFDLLISQPCVEVNACLFGTQLCYNNNISKRDERASEIWVRLLEREKRQDVRIDCFKAAVVYGANRTATLIWTSIASYGMDHVRLMKPIKSHDGLVRNVLGCAAIRADDRLWQCLSFYVEQHNLWNLHKLGAKQSYERSPLVDILECDNCYRLGFPVLDERAAWLCTRLPNEHLNRYSFTGDTPLMMVIHASDIFPRALVALTKRISDIDVLAPELVPFNGKYEKDEEKGVLLSDHVVLSRDFISEDMDNLLSEENAKSFHIIRDAVESQKQLLIERARIFCMELLGLQFPKDLMILFCLYADLRGGDPVITGPSPVEPVQPSKAPVFGANTVKRRQKRRLRKEEQSKT